VKLTRPLSEAASRGRAADLGILRDLIENPRSWNVVPLEHVLSARAISNPRNPHFAGSRKHT